MANRFDKYKSEGEAPTVTVASGNRFDKYSEQATSEPVGALEDVARTIPSSIAKGLFKAPLWAADMMNAASQGAARVGGTAYQALGGDLSIDQAKALTNYKPFYGSDELIVAPLKSVGIEFYEPETTAGAITDFVGEMLGYGGAERGVRNLTNKIAQQGVKTALNPFTVSNLPKPNQVPKAYKKIYDRLRADYPDDAKLAEVLNKYASKKGEALIQAGGERTTNIAKGSAQYPSGGAKATEFFDEAVSGTGASLKKVVAETVSPKTDYFATVDDLLKVGRKEAAPLYKGAFKANQSVQSPVIDRVLQSDVGKKALREAALEMNTALTGVAKPNPKLTALAKDLGTMGKVSGDTTGGVAAGLKLESLDLVKKSLDDMISTASRKGDSTKNLVTLKNNLVKELDRLDTTGLYAKARSRAGDYLSSNKAIEAGNRYLKDDPDVVANMMKGFSKPEKAAYKVGVARSIRNKIDKTTDGRNVTTLFGNEAARQKARAVLSKDEYATLFNEAKYTDNIFRLRNKITANSDTASKQIAAREFDDPANELVQQIAANGFSGVAKGKVVGFVQRTFDGLSDNMAREVAEILYETDPKKKFEIIKKLTEIANSSKGAAKTDAITKAKAFFTMSDDVAAAKDKLGAAGKQLLRDERGSMGGLGDELPSRAISKKTMLDRGADGHLSTAYERYIPIKQLDGLEPVPANNFTASGKYIKGRKVTQPIEVAYDTAQDKFMVYGGNHRIAQAKANGQTHIKAFVEPDRASGRDFISPNALRAMPNDPAKANSSDLLAMKAPLALAGGGAIAAAANPNSAQANPFDEFDAMQQQTIKEQKIRDTEIQQRTEAGTTSPYFDQLAQVESSNNYNAKASTSSAFGKYQITNGTAKALIKKYGDSIGVDTSNWKQPASQEKLARALTQENQAMLRSKLGREPSAGEMYIAHFAGIGGVKKLLSKANNNKKAASIMPAAAKANKNIYFETGKGGKIIRARSVFEVRELLKRKMET